MTAPPPGLVQQAERLLGRSVATARVAAGGYTPAERWVLGFDDGTSAFAKRAPTPLTAGWLRQEHALYRAMGEREWTPRLLAWEDGEAPLLLLEDLSAGHWPPPWGPGQVALVMDVLQQVGRTSLPLALPAFASMPGYEPPLRSAWDRVAREPAALLALGLCTGAWLDRALPALIESQAAPLDGTALLHGDLRSDNLCFMGSRVVLIDWNGAATGNAVTDIAFWLPSLEFEGGPRPEDACPAANDLAGVVAGFFAARAGLPRIPDAPLVRRVQQQQLSTALPWAARVLGLPPPDGPRARP